MASQTSNREKFIASTLPQSTTTVDGAEFVSLLMSRDKIGTEQPISVKPMALTDFVSFELSLVPEVEAVFTTRHGNLFYLWIVVDPFVKAIREKIYNREREIINEFREFEFDFNIIFRRGRDLNELVSDPQMTLTYQRGSRGLLPCAN